jgi:hypothetical protein
MRVTCSQCPLQIEGPIDGEEFYFRARGEHWSMGIGGDPVLRPTWHMQGPWGDGPFEAGYMPEQVGEAIAQKCCELWRIAVYKPDLQKAES